MTQEDKELLLKDLCGRLPYEVKCHIKDGVTEIDDVVTTTTIEYIGKWKVTPYLHPMSSMTEEEKIELSRLCHFTSVSENCETIEHGIRILDEISGDFYAPSIVVDAIDWLNAHHFDYCGLIEKGLAIEAPEGMYKTESNE